MTGKFKDGEFMGLLRRLAKGQRRIKDQDMKKEPKQMNFMKDPDTILWRKERGLTQKPEAVLLYCPNLITSGKLKAVLHLHELSFSEPLLNAILVAGDTKILGLVVRQWRESLSSTECNDIRGNLFETRMP